MQRCIIIEPSPIIRRVSRVILTDCGFDVTEAATARDGIAAFNRHVPHLVMIDASIPDMPVLEVLRHMRNAAGGRVQLIYCTTEFNLLDLQRAQAAGATDVLVKPFDRASLVARLDAWCFNTGSDDRPSYYNRLSRSELVRTS